MSYRLSYLKDNNLWNYSVNSTKSTDSTIYLLPIFGVARGNFGQSLINAYLKRSDFPSIVIVCSNNVEDGVLFNTLETLKLSKYYIDMWYDDNDKEICIELKIPDEYYNVYEYFVDGKFSKFPDKYKDKLLTIYGRKVEKATRQLTIISVLYPNINDSFKRKQIADWLQVDVKLIDEVKDIPNMDIETYRTIDQLKVLVEFKKSNNFTEESHYGSV